MPTRLLSLALVVASCGSRSPPQPVWTPTRSMTSARSAATATLLGTGLVLVSGGLAGCAVDDCISDNPQFGWATSSAELYNPGTSTWRSTDAMLHARWFHVAVLLSSRAADRPALVLVAGGVARGDEYAATRLTSAELYDPASGTWMETGAMNVARHLPAAALLGDGRVVVAGGVVSGSLRTAAYATASTEMYDPATGSWSVASPMSAARGSATGTLLQSSGRFLVAGGWSVVYNDAAGAFRPDAEVLDPVTGQWSSTGALVTTRCCHAAVELQSGRVLVAGGYTVSAGSLRGLREAELYDPAAGSWTATAPMKKSRAWFQLTLLPSGKVLASGGTDVPTAELYDPETGTWTDAGQPLAGRSFQTATLLPSGRVLVAGGNSLSHPLQSAELFSFE